MKLSELVNSISLKAREITNYIRYPVANASMIMQRRFKEEYEKIEIPVNKKDTNEENKVLLGYSPRATIIDSRQVNDINEFTSDLNNFYTGVASQTIPPLASKQNVQIETPPLQINDEIRGRRGRYRIISHNVSNKLNRVRFYQGIQVANNKPVLIKEYLIPDAEFNQKEARQCKESFEELTSINLKNGGGQDFRLLVPWDAIAPRDERRCYLINEPVDKSITLREYLENNPMNSQQVREFLKQVLQTLWFLHNQRVRLPNGEVHYGLPHGNLSLDTLLIVVNEQNSLVETPQFLIYLQDLALWQDLFQPHSIPRREHSFLEDLQDLGYISYSLLIGREISKIYPLITLQNEQCWLNEKDEALKLFILRLLGIESSFSNAEQARQFLLALPYIPSSSQEQDEPLIDDIKEKYIINISRFLKFILLGITFGTISFISVYLLVMRKNREKFVINPNINQYSQITDIDNIPNGSFTYTALRSEGTWDSLYYIDKNKRINRTSLVAFGKTFKEELQERGMRLRLTYKREVSIEQALTKLQNKEVDFLIKNLGSNQHNEFDSKDFKYQTIAYDGIVIFVPFSDSQRKGSITEALNGKITFEQLRKLYTNKITNWQEIDQRLPNLPVKLYIPQEIDVVNHFKEVVFKDYPEEAQIFEELIASGYITRQETRDTLGSRILGDFENNINAGIGFGLLSKVFGQCSVYPLSLGQPGKEVQTLIQNNGKDINSKTDLCNDKGSYHPNPQVFANKLYPLSYAVTVVYPISSKRSQSSLAASKFVEVLKTDEGQDLLREAGLVPEGN
ncbi:MAG TPA: substrate-binding domain-containing protein [Trichormus sp. M33_DOE_039]|nr:substrate-binding domain-containing protein [Trichormus sp. M33_DOE_039]